MRQKDAVLMDVPEGRKERTNDSMGLGEHRFPRKKSIVSGAVNFLHFHHAGSLQDVTLLRYRF
jgi:hypothetical protein